MVPPFALVVDVTMVPPLDLVVNVTMVPPLDLYRCLLNMRRREHRIGPAFPCVWRQSIAG